ncbi:MAG: hypothetical protein AAF957_17335 [Planctomycetota bacterium]
MKRLRAPLVLALGQLAAVSAAPAQTPDIDPVRRPEWQPLGALEGAAPFIFAIEDSALAPNELFAASTAGLLHSSDRGASWSLRSRWPNQAVQLAALAVAPTDPQRVVAARALSGVDVSEDGGFTWAAPLVAPTGIVWDVAVDPVVATRFLAGTDTGLWASEDGGTTFTPIIDTTGTGDAARHVRFDRNNRLRIYASLEPGQLVGSEDGGQTWTLRTLPAGPSFYFGLEVDPHDGRRIVMAGGGIHVSSDGGMTWTSVVTPTTESFDFVHFDAVREGHLFATARDDGVWTSSDMGATWTRYGAPDLARAGGSVRAYFSSAAYPGEVLLGSGAGFFRSTDGGATFARSNAGLAEHAYVRSVAVDPADPMRVVVNTGGSAYVSTNGGDSWTESAVIEDFDSFEIVADASLPGRFYAGGRRIDGAELWRSDDGGHTFDVVSSDPGLYFWNVEAHPTLSGVLFGAGSGLRRSDDGGVTWTNAGVPAGWIWDVTVSPADPMVIHASTSSTVYTSDDGGSTWTAATTPPATIVRDLEAHPTNPDVVLASVPLGGLWRSSDRGATWSLVPGSPETCNVARFAPGVPGGILAGAWLAVGVVFNGPGPAGFPAYGRGIETTVVGIHVSPTGTYAATQGAGVFVLR